MACTVPQQSKILKERRMWVAGVDGCRAGWMAALMAVDDPASIRVRVVPALVEILDGPERPCIVAVDMPIGLPDRTEGSGRAPERLIRPLLGQRQSSVFAIPSRSAVHAKDYGAACTLALATSEPPRKVSRQGFNLFPKIREIDLLLRARPDLISRVFEVHPELVFWSLNGRKALGEPKKVRSRPHEPGLVLRRALLAEAGLPDALLDAAPPSGAAIDDLIDALAGLTVALDLARGGGQSFPDPPGRDAHGLPVAIWTLRP
jgi:predicted RNase H-like nuclease